MTRKEQKSATHSTKNGTQKIVKIVLELSGKEIHVKATDTPVRAIFSVLNQEKWGCGTWGLVGDGKIITDYDQPIKNFETIHILTTLIAGIDLKTILEEHKKWYNNEGGTKADLQRADLQGADLREADLWGADLREADLRRADLWRADLQEADLRRADLRRADLREATLREATLLEADLREADLRRADLWRADLRRADLQEADLREAALYNVSYGGNIEYINDAIQRFAYIRVILESQLISEQISDEISKQIKKNE